MLRGLSGPNNQLAREKRDSDEEDQEQNGLASADRPAADLQQAGDGPRGLRDGKERPVWDY
jgi:hypothetical protein